MHRHPIDITLVIQTNLWHSYRLLASGALKSILTSFSHYNEMFFMRKMYKYILNDNSDFKNIFNHAVVCST